MTEIVIIRRQSSDWKIGLQIDMSIVGCGHTKFLSSHMDKIKVTTIISLKVLW